MVPTRKNHPPAQDAFHVLEEDKNDWVCLCQATDPGDKGTRAELVVLVTKPDLEQPIRWLLALLLYLQDQLLPQALLLHQPGQVFIDQQQNLFLFLLQLLEQ